MDPVENPYAPGAGTSPPELAGRDDIVKAADTALQRIKKGHLARSMILVGLRGVGKTALLNKFLDLAEQSDCLVSGVLEAGENRTLAELLAPFFRKSLNSLRKYEAAKEMAGKAWRVLKSFAASTQLKIHDVELSFDPEIGTADSGDLENDLPDMFLALGEAAKASGKPIIILLDEMQYLSTTELSALITSIHKISQRGLPILLFGAGLPQFLGLAGNAKTYAERLFDYRDIGALSDAAATSAIRNPAQKMGVSFADNAVAELLKETEKYPYFIQQWAYEAWNMEENKKISLATIKRTTPKAIAALDESFFQVRFDRCTLSEKRYMRALAELGDGSHRSSDIADKLGVKPQSVAPARNNLIKKGMIYSPAYGDTAFTVPQFHDFMKRKMDLQ